MPKEETTVLSSINRSACNNPFSTEFTDCVPYRFETGNWDSNWNRLQSLKFHAAIVGPKGTGKTTLLEQLASRFSDQVRVVHRPVTWQTNDSRAFVDGLLDEYRRGAILMVDSIERLSFFQRRRLLRFVPRAASRSGLIVTCHVPCRLPTWIETHGSIDSLQHVLEHLQLADGQDASLPGRVSELADHVLQSHDGNVRQAIRDLYDRFAAGELQSM